MDETRLHHRTCPLCEAMCGLVIEHRGGEILSIKPDRDDVLSRGHICPKAVALKDIHEDPDRLRRPVRRTVDGLGRDLVGCGFRRGRATYRRGARAPRAECGGDLRRQPHGAQPRRDARGRRFHPGRAHPEPVLRDQRGPVAPHGGLARDVRAPVPHPGPGRGPHAAVRLHRRQSGRLRRLDHGGAGLREARRGAARTRRAVRRDRPAAHRVGRGRRRAPVDPPGHRRVPAARAAARGLRRGARRPRASRRAGRGSRVAARGGARLRSRPARRADGHFRRAGRRARPRRSPRSRAHWSTGAWAPARRSSAGSCSG